MDQRQICTDILLCLVPLNVTFSALKGHNLPTCLRAEGHLCTIFSHEMKRLILIFRVLFLQVVLVVQEKTHKAYVWNRTITFDTVQYDTIFYGEF